LEIERIVFSRDVDRSDPKAFAEWQEAVDAWLNHPVVKARHEDSARQFRREPAEMQIPVLEKTIKDDEDRLEQLLVAMADPDLPAEVLAGFQELKAAMESSIQGARERIIVLKLDGPDEG
jgi:hypothetical protein